MDRRARIIALNDQLRTTFKGGRVQMTRGVYDLDDRLRGRALSVMARYNKFDDDSEHDCGVFIFAGLLVRVAHRISRQGRQRGFA